MYDRRWYDSHEHTTRAFEILKDMNDAQRRAIAKDLTTVDPLSFFRWQLPG